MSGISWDVSGLSGNEAQLVIIDKASGDWGHIAVDHIYLSDRPLVDKSK